jgi:hypothetical protein
MLWIFTIFCLLKYPLSQQTHKMTLYLCFVLWFMVCAPLIVWGEEACQCHNSIQRDSFFQDGRCFTQAMKVCLETGAREAIAKYLDPHFCENWNNHYVDIEKAMSKTKATRLADLNPLWSEAIRKALSTVETEFAKVLDLAPTEIMTQSGMPLLKISVFSLGHIETDKPVFLYMAEALARMFAGENGINDATLPPELQNAMQHSSEVQAMQRSLEMQIIIGVSVAYYIHYLAEQLWQYGGHVWADKTVALAKIKLPVPVVKINPSVFDQLTKAEQQSVLLHEAFHLFIDGIGTRQTINEALDQSKSMLSRSGVVSDVELASID